MNQATATVRPLPAIGTAGRNTRLIGVILALGQIRRLPELPIGLLPERGIGPHIQMRIRTHPAAALVVLPKTIHVIDSCEFAAGAGEFHGPVRRRSTCPPPSPNRARRACAHVTARAGKPARRKQPPSPRARALPRAAGTSR